MNFLTKNAFFLTTICAFSFSQVLFSQPTGQATTQGSGAQAQQSAPQQISWSNISQMIAAPQDSYFFLEAKIKSVKSPDAGSLQPWILYVQDNTGIARVVIFQETWNQMENPEQFEPGVIIQVYGKTNDYKEIRQLVTEGPKWIRLKPDVLQIPDRLRRGDAGQSSSDQENFIETSVGGIGISAIGHNVVVRGMVKSIQPSERARVPTKIILADQTGEIEVVYWSEVSSNLTQNNTPVEGRLMEFKGKVGEYKDVMQIVVTNPSYISPKS